MKKGGDLDPTLVPRATGADGRTGGRDLTRLATNASEVRVLAQIDGAASVGEIADVSGVSFDVVADVLRQLERAGVIEIGEARGGPSLRSKSPAPQPSAPSVKPRAPSVKPRAVSVKPRALTKPKSGSAKPKPLSNRPSKSRLASPPVEIGEALQRQIDELHARLATSNLYEILGVARNADSRAIKGAFFALATTLHPDRYYTKRLGPFGPKLNEVFARITAAYDTLSSPMRRTAYDATLPAYEPPPAREPASRASSSAELPPQESGPREKAPAVRIAFAARMGGTPGRPPSTGSSSASSTGSSASTGRDPSPSGEALKRFFEDKVDEVGRKKARAFVESAQVALARGDAVSAVQQYKLALQCSDAPDIRAALARAEQAAQGALFDINLRHGRAAERDGRWAEAAKRYGRAYEQRRDASLAERIALSLVRAGGDLRLAVKRAEEAVAMEPDNVAFRATLSEAFLEAGLEARARTEAQRAAKSAPTHPRIKELLAKLAKASKRR